MRKLFGIAALFLSLLAFQAVVLVSPASGASAFDTALESTDTAKVQKSGCPTLDLTYTWENYITHNSFLDTAYPTESATFKSKWADTKLNGESWGVMQYSQTTNAGTGTRVRIWFNPVSTSMNWVDAYNIYVMDYDSTKRFYYLDVYYQADAGCTLYTYPSEDLCCINLIAGGNAKVLMLNVDSLNYPSGYEGELFVSAVPPAKYVAMGDSFSSGEGNPSFEYGTDEEDVNECHRSPKAYPRLLQEDLNLGPMAFVACSGAWTSNVHYGQWNEDPQVDALTDDTEVVTITVGGNDIGFAPYIQSCLVSTCGPSTDDYEWVMDNIDDPYFLSNLEETYTEILENATTADVYVADYPYMSASDATICMGFDFSGARSVQVALNATIALAVANVRGESEDYEDRLHYVSTNESGSPFEGKHMCNGGSVDFDWTDFHPNEQGHEHYMEVLHDAMI